MVVSSAFLRLLIFLPAILIPACAGIHKDGVIRISEVTDVSPSNLDSSLCWNQIPYDYTVEVRNRFKGLDLIDRMSEELWTEVYDIVQEAVIKTIPKKKKYKKAKWFSEEALQIAVKRRSER